MKIKKNWLVKYIPSLIQVDKEDQIVAEAGDSMSGGHSDDKGEHVVYESIKGLVHKSTPWKRGHGAQTVVDEQLRQHEEETECVNAVHCAVQRPRIPSAKEYWCLSTWMATRMLSGIR